MCGCVRERASERASDRACVIQVSGVGEVGGLCVRAADFPCHRHRSRAPKPAALSPTRPTSSPPNRSHRDVGARGQRKKRMHRRGRTRLTSPSRHMTYLILLPTPVPLCSLQRTKHPPRLPATTPLSTALVGTSRVGADKCGRALS